MTSDGCSDPAESNSSRSTAVAFWENTEKLTPPSSGTAPRGWQRPAETARWRGLGVMGSFLSCLRRRPELSDRLPERGHCQPLMSPVCHWVVTARAEPLETGTNPGTGGVDVGEAGRFVEPVTDVTRGSDLDAERLGVFGPVP